METPRSYSLLIPLFLLPFFGAGQVDSSDNWNTYDAYQELQKGEKGRDSGKVRVHQPQLLDSLIAAYRDQNKEFPGIEGYRVQLFFGKREKAKELKEDFEEEYPDIGAYIDYLAPNFRLRVGDFRTRIDAYRLMQDLGDDLGRPYIVRTTIELPKLSIEEEE